MQAQTSPRPQSSEPPLACAWCEATDELVTFPNVPDWDVLRQPEPPRMTLCRPCLTEVGIRLDDEDIEACCEHRAGCPAGAHYTRKAAA